MNNYTKPKGPTCSEPIAEYGAARIPPGSGEHTAFAGEPDHAEPVPPCGAASARAVPSMPRARHRFGSVAGQHGGARRGQAGRSWREGGGSPRAAHRDVINPERWR